MVIGNNPKITASLFAPQYTMAAVIANEFTEAANDLYLSALIEIGLVLFVITLLINAVSRFLIWSVTREIKVKVPKPALHAWRSRRRAGRRAVNGRAPREARSSSPARRRSSAAPSVAARSRPALLRLLLRPPEGLLVAELGFLHEDAEARRRAGRRHGERDRRDSHPHRARRRSVAVPVGVIAGVYLSEYGKRDVRDRSSGSRRTS